MSRIQIDLRDDGTMALSGSGIERLQDWTARHDREIFIGFRSGADDAVPVYGEVPNGGVFCGIHGPDAEGVGR